MLGEGDFACGGRAVLNGMRSSTRSLWRPELVQRRRPLYDSGWEPVLRCYPAISRERCVQCSLPCVGRSGRGTLRRSLKVGLQKRIRFGCCRRGKHLGCQFLGDHRIAVRTQWQSGTGLGDDPARRRTGNRLHRRREVLCGESIPDLSRKINCDGCHCLLLSFQNTLYYRGCHCEKVRTPCGNPFPLAFV